LLVSIATTSLIIFLLPRRNPRVFGRRRPRFPFVLSGKLLIGLAALQCLFSIAWVILGRADTDMITKSVDLLIIVIAFASSLIFLGRRVKAPVSLEEIAQEDPRALVLYLRPFVQESQFFVSVTNRVMASMLVGSNASLWIWARYSQETLLFLPTSRSGSGSNSISPAL